VIDVLDDGNPVVFGKPIEPETFQVVSGLIERLPEQRIGCYPRSFEKSRSRAAIDRVFSKDMACPGTSNEYLRNGVAARNSPWLSSTTIEKVSIPELKSIIKIHHTGMSPSSMVSNTLKMHAVNDFSPSLAREVIVQEWMENVDDNFYMRDSNDNPGLQDLLAGYKWRRKIFTPGKEREFGLGDVESSFMERVMKVTNKGTLFSRFTNLVLGNHYLPVEVTERFVSRYRPVLLGAITKNDLRTASSIRNTIFDMIGLFDTIGERVSIQDDGTPVSSPPIVDHVAATLPLMVFNDEGENEVANHAISAAIKKVVKTGTINDLFVLVGEAEKADQKITAKKRHAEEVFKRLERKDDEFVREIDRLDKERYLIEDEHEKVKRRGDKDASLYVAEKLDEIEGRIRDVADKRDENIPDMQSAWKKFDEMPEFVSLERSMRNAKLK